MLQEWFCLAEGRKNFQIDPARDQEYLFGEPSWQADIDNRLKRAQLLSTPLRLCWWGQYGIGKTHRLKHTEFSVRKSGYKYHPCYVIMSDIQEKTGYERLHYELVNSLGREEMRELVSSYLLKFRNKTPGVRALKELCTGSPDVEAALRSFGGDNEQLVMPAWRFLCGLRLEKGALSLANVMKPELESSNDFSTVLSALATIIQQEKGNELLYLVDQVEGLTKITNKSAEARWQESLRALLDINNLSIIFAVGAERMEGVPKIIVQPEILRRLQKDNLVAMEAYKPPVAKNFVRALLGKWIDPEKRKELEKKEGWPGSVPDYAAELYPFTQSGFDKFCDWAVVDPRTAKPSEIIARLNNVAAEAYFKGRRLITKDHLTEMGIA